MWTAVSLGFAYLAMSAAYGWWAVQRIESGAAAWPFILAFPLIFLVFPLLLVSVSFVLSWLFRAERPADARLSWRDSLHLFWYEFRAVAGDGPRLLLHRVLLREPRPAPSSRPILLIHGVLCNAGIWSPFKRWLDARNMGPVYTLSYGPPLAPVDTFADQAAARIDAILAATGAAQVVVVGHSLGGIVMRAYLRRYGGAKIARLITVGTPHEGSVHAYMGFGTSIAQLRPGNDWMGALATPAGPALPPIVSIWSWHDSMVAPQTSSRIAFGHNITVAGIGHNALLRDARVFELILAEIEKAPHSLDRK